MAATGHSRRGQCWQPPGIAVLPRLSGRPGLAQGAIVLWGRARGAAGGGASTDTVMVLSPPWPRVCVPTLLPGSRARWWHCSHVVTVGLSWGVYSGSVPPSRGARASWEWGWPQGTNQGLFWPLFTGLARALSRSRPLLIRDSATAVESRSVPLCPPQLSVILSSGVMPPTPGRHMSLVSPSCRGTWGPGGQDPLFGCFGESTTFPTTIPVCSQTNPKQPTGLSPKSCLVPGAAIPSRASAPAPTEVVAQHHVPPVGGSHPEFGGGLNAGGGLAGAPGERRGRADNLLAGMWMCWLRPRTGAGIREQPEQGSTEFWGKVGSRAVVRLKEPQP